MFFADNANMYVFISSGKKTGLVIQKKALSLPFYLCDSHESIPFCFHTDSDLVLISNIFWICRILSLLDEKNFNLEFFTSRKTCIFASRANKPHPSFELNYSDWKILL